MTAPTACGGFKWVGQSLAFCDGCGHPYWDHTHDEFRGKLTPITPEQAEACRRKWGPA